MFQVQIVYCASLSSVYTRPLTRIPIRIKLIQVPVNALIRIATGLRTRLRSRLGFEERMLMLAWFISGLSAANGSYQFHDE